MTRRRYENVVNVRDFLEGGDGGLDFRLLRRRSGWSLRRKDLTRRRCVNVIDFEGGIDFRLLKRRSTGNRRWIGSRWIGRRRSEMTRSTAAKSTRPVMRRSMMRRSMMRRPVMRRPVMRRPVMRRSMVGRSMVGRSTAAAATPLGTTRRAPLGVTAVPAFLHGTITVCGGINNNDNIEVRYMTPREGKQDTHTMTGPWYVPNSAASKAISSPL
jgi:hypothetical protein